MIKGELGLGINYIQIKNGDLTFYTNDGGFLHIVGDNDWAKLLEDALAKMQK